MRMTSLAVMALLVCSPPAFGRSLNSQTALGPVNSGTAVNVTYSVNALGNNGLTDWSAQIHAVSTTWEDYFTPANSESLTDFGAAGHNYFTPTRFSTCYTADTSSTAAFHNPDEGRSAYSRAFGEFCRAKDPREKPPIDNCPIVLDLGRNGLNLSGPSPAVSFDINADGAPNQLAWTRRQSDDAFLCLDRNGNGTIDDGTELFGYATPLASGEPAVVGFNALAELDVNHDGVVSVADPVWARLCVWRDSNRDGISQASEISALSSTSVLSIGTSYVTTPLSDAYGNLYRYLGWTTMRGPGNSTVQWPAYDVILQEAH